MVKEKIKWGIIDKSIQNLEGWEWIWQEIVSVPDRLDRKEIKKLFTKLYEKVNPIIHYDVFRAIKNGGSIVKIAHFPVYIPPPPKERTKYLNGHIKDPLQQKWFRPLPILQNKQQAAMPTAQEWDDALRQLDIAYAKTQLSKEDAIALKGWIALFAREWERIKNGCWIFVKGVPTYICGSYYFFLTYWGNKEGSHNEYIEAGRHEFLHAEALIKTLGIKGRLMFARRQAGKTTTHFCLEYWITLVTQLTSIVQSKSLKDIVDNFTEHYTPKIIGLPFIFKPYTEAELQGALGVIKRKQVRGKFDDSVKVNQLEINFQHGVGYQGGRVMGLQPNAKAADGKTLGSALNDEFGKQENDIVQMYDVIAPAVPKIFWTTTVEHINANVMPQCRELAESSDYVDADSRIRKEYNCGGFATSSLLDWCYSGVSDFNEFISNDKEYAPIFNELQGKITIKGMVQYINPAWFCFVDRADRVRYIDEWGQSMSVGAYAYLSKQRIKLFDFCKSTGNMAAYHSYIRKYPFNIEEALGDDSIDNLFDVPAINAQIKKIQDARAYGKSYIEVSEKEFYMSELEGDTHSHAAKEKIAEIEKMTGVVRIPLYEKYSLKWSNGRFSPVIAVPDKNGLHEIAEFPDILNNVRWEDGVKQVLGNKEDGYTPKNMDYVGGIDSIDMPTDDLTGKSKPSDFCLIIKASKRCKKVTNNRPIHRLKFRPRDPEEAYEEALKALWLFGCSAGFENGKEAFKTWAKKLDCIKFISLAVEIDTTQNPNKKQLTFRGNTNTGKDKEINFLNLAHYIAYYVNRVTDLALLKSLKGLTYKNLTKRDDCAAAMQAETTDISPSKLSVALGNRKDKTAYRAKIGGAFFNE